MHLARPGRPAAADHPDLLVEVEVAEEVDALPVVVEGIKKDNRFSE
jgi:hypothetical protein